MSQLTRLGDLNRQASLDIIFVHGLEGDSARTWSWRGPETFWPKWVEEDFPDAAVWTVDYDVRALSWSGNTMALGDRATNILGLLHAHGIGTRPLAFVCHSFGGLLTKEILRIAAQIEDSGWKDLIHHVRGVAFLATPHGGSSKADWLMYFARLLSPSTAVAELKSHDSELRLLNLWYRNNAPRLGIETLVIHETQRTSNLLIVDPGSADPGMPGVVPVPVDSNHLNICKPEDRGAEVFQLVKKKLKGWFSSDFDTVESKRKVIIRIDVGAQIKVSPSIRENILTVGSGTIPDGSSQYPNGSVATAPDDGVYFAVNKPSAALRGSIDFMRGWHASFLSGANDCRIIIGQGSIANDGSVRFVEPRIIQADYPTGSIYLTEDVSDRCDPTMSSFSAQASSQDQFGTELFRAEFSDPRTVRDSSLIHALFVAHPEADEVRRQLIQLFVVEYLLQNDGLTEIVQLREWLKARNYPAPSISWLQSLLESSEHIEVLQSPERTYKLKHASAVRIADERSSFKRAQRECVEIIQRSIVEDTGTEAAITLVDFVSLLDEYLSAVFLEVRLMANYLRRTGQIFDGGAQTLRKFDHIINRRLPSLPDVAKELWRSAFLRGLKIAAESKNVYVASLFHNVLATYYLNRSPTAGSYQRDLLCGRYLYVDTNVLYAVRVGASNHHEMIEYLLTQLTNLRFSIRVFPFTINEFENTIKNEERAFHDGVPEPWLVNNNPWLYQEFRSNHAAYFTMKACREVHSFTKGDQFGESDYDRVDHELKPIGMEIERRFQTLDEPSITEKWQDLISKMTSNAWDMDRWWEFRHAAMSKSPKAIEHDVLALYNTESAASREGSDALGPRVLFLTLDGEHLLRLRRKYNFIVGMRQCQEFFLPYLFLNDVPVKQTIAFPNELLSAQMGSLLLHHRPKALEVIESSMKSDKFLQLLDSERMPDAYRDVAKALNQDRLREIFQTAKGDPDLENKVTVMVADLLESGRSELLREQYIARSKDQEIARLTQELEKERDRAAKINAEAEKLVRTNRYLRSQKDRK